MSVEPITIPAIAPPGKPFDAGLLGVSSDDGGTLPDSEVGGTDSDVVGVVSLLVGVDSLVPVDSLVGGSGKSFQTAVIIVSLEIVIVAPASYSWPKMFQHLNSLPSGALNPQAGKM